MSKHYQFFVNTGYDCIVLGASATLVKYYFFLVPAINFENLYVLFLLFLRACYGVLRFVMESGAKGCEVSYPMFQFLVLCIS